VRLKHSHAPFLMFTPLYTLLRYPMVVITSEQRGRATVILYHQSPILLSYYISLLLSGPLYTYPIPNLPLHPHLVDPLFPLICLTCWGLGFYSYYYKQRIGDYHIISYRITPCHILKVLTRFLYKIYWLLFLPSPSISFYKQIYHPYLISILLLSNFVGSSLAS